MSSRISLSAYKKKKDALAVAPASADRRSGFGASTVTREARAQALQSETRSLERLESLLKRCSKSSACAQAKSEWLCSEGLKGHGKKGLSQLLCYVRVWSGTLRAEGQLPERDRDIDALESRARAAFGACACALKAVDIAFSRFTASSEGTKARDSHLELKNLASDALNGMLQAMVGAGNRPRARGLHPVEHAQLTEILDSWRSRGVLLPSPLQCLEKSLATLKPPPPTTGLAGEEAAGVAKNRPKRAAWIAVPLFSHDDNPHEAAPVGRSPTGLASAADRGMALSLSGSRTDDDREASIEVCLKELLARNAKNTDEWWGCVFEGRGPFREGPEGYWSMHLRRLQDDAQVRRNQGRALVGVNGDRDGLSGDWAWRAGETPANRMSATVAGGKADLARDPVDLQDAGDNMKVEGESQENGTPSSPSTVPSEASPSPEPVSPTPAAVAPVVPTPKSESVKEESTEGEPRSEPRVKELSPSSAKVDESGQPQEDKDDADLKAEPHLKPQQEQQEKPRSPEKRVLSKEEREAEERQRRKEEARLAGKKKGKMRGLEIERQKKDRELQRQHIIAETKERKEAADRAERKAKEMAEAAVAVEEEALRRRKESEERARRAKASEARSAEEEGRRGHGKSRERERERMRGEQDGSRKERDAEARGGRLGERAGKSGRDIDGWCRDGRGNLSENEETEKGNRRKERDRARGREKEDGRWNLDVNDGIHGRSRGKDHEDIHHEVFDDRERDGRRAYGSHRSTEDPDTTDARLKNDSKERDTENNVERKRRRRSKGDQEAGERRGTRSDNDDRDHKASKKKSKKDRKEKKEKRREHRHSERAKAGSEETRGRKRSRDFHATDLDGAPPLEEKGSRPRDDSRDFGMQPVDLPPRRSADPHTHHRPAEPELGRSGSERRGMSRQRSLLEPGSSLSRHDSERPAKGGGSEDRRNGRGDGSEKRSRRNEGDGGADAPGDHHRAVDTARERHTMRASNREPSSSSAGRGGGLPGMDVYGAEVSPPTGLEVGRHDSKPRSGRNDHYGGGSGSTSLDRYGLSASTGREGPSQDRRKGDGSRPGLAAMVVYGPSLEDDVRSGNREEKGNRERDYAPADRVGREASLRQGDSGLRQSGSSTFRRRSPEKGQTSKRDASGRWRPSSPASYDSRSFDGKDDLGGRSSGQTRHRERGPSSVRGGSGRTGPSETELAAQGSASSDLGVSVLEGSHAVVHGGVLSESGRSRPRLDDRERMRLDDRERMRLDDRDRMRLDDRERARLDDRDVLRLEDRNRLRLDNRDRPRQDGFDRSMLDDRDKPRLNDRDRPRLDGRDRSTMDDRNRQRLEDRDRSMMDDRNRQRLEDRDRSMMDDRNRQRLDDRDRLRPDNRDWPMVDIRDRPIVDGRGRPILDGRDRQRLGDRERQRLGDRDRPMLDIRDRPMLDIRDRPMLDMRDRPMLNDRNRPPLMLNDRDRPPMMPHDRDRPILLNNRDRPPMMLNDRDRPVMLSDRDRHRPIMREEWRGRPQDWLGRTIDRRRGDAARHDRGIGSRERHDSRDEEAAADAEQPVEDEPEEGELVIELSASLPTPTPTSSTTKKSRWGKVSREDEVVRRDGGARDGLRPSRDRARGDKRRGEGETGERSVDDDDAEEGEIGSSPQVKGDEGGRSAYGGQTQGGDDAEKVVEDSALEETPAQSIKGEDGGSSTNVKVDGESFGSLGRVEDATDEGITPSATRRSDSQDNASLASRGTDLEPPVRLESLARESGSIPLAETKATGMAARESQEQDTTAQEGKGEKGGVDAAREDGPVSAGVCSSLAEKRGDYSARGDPENPSVESNAEEGDTSVPSGSPSEKRPPKQVGSGGAAESSKRRLTGDPGNLSLFIRKNPPGPTAGTSHSTTIASASAVDDGAPRHRSASDSSSKSQQGASSHESGTHVSVAGNESTAVSNAVSVSSVAAPDDSRAPRAPVGLAATWGSGRSTHTISGWGGGNGAGAGVGTLGTSDAAVGVKKEGGGKEEVTARPGGAASRLMNAALQSTRDVGRREKKGAEGGRSRG